MVNVSDKVNRKFRWNFVYNFKNLVVELILDVY